jgi:hypothetical protein
MADDTYSICTIDVYLRIRNVYISEIIANKFINSSICVCLFMDCILSLNNFLYLITLLLSRNVLLEGMSAQEKYIAK